ncbi:hypothetical protein PF002_g8268 [Phytophthora fragariae]|uniref:Uncharacterized protein n=1 Tax=Phytophthora fragariae TaxID=53985 RepID=A0A6A3ZZY3_9STRA|nr:hypothetical protein PF002_g8268 [Phytophthora fragariae]
MSRLTTLVFRLIAGGGGGARQQQGNFREGPTSHAYTPASVEFSRPCDTPPWVYTN